MAHYIEEQKPNDTNINKKEIIINGKSKFDLSRSTNSNKNNFKQKYIENNSMWLIFQV